MMAPIPTHLPTMPSLGAGIVVVTLVMVGAAVLASTVLLRNFFRGKPSRSPNDWANPKPATENPSAFMAASMQGVIERLRAQEKELARLHSLAQERAQESERLTEEVTRNMPTGLLLVNATGAISSTNPAAEEALGIGTLRYRSYKEILGADSDLTRMLTACLRDAQTIQRGEVEHMTASGEVRHLGVTISPIYRPVRNPARGNPALHMKVSGALCLMSDLTELTALQKQM